MIFEKFLDETAIKALQITGDPDPKSGLKKSPQQIEAIYCSGENVLVSASAGSGKTFVMKNRIVDKVKRGVKIEELFISTFTVKAATELKERIESGLQDLIDETEDLELKTFYSQQLAAMPGAPIGTMDSFTQQLVNEYGYLIGISANYSILQDESVKTQMKKESFNKIFDRYFESKGTLFIKLVKNFTGNTKSNIAFQEIVERVYDFAQSTAAPEEWLDEIFLSGQKNRDLSEVDEVLLDRAKNLCLEVKDFFAYHLRNEAEYFPKAKYLENVEKLLEKLSFDFMTADLDEFKEALRSIVEIKSSSRGKGLTNATRKDDTKELRDAYNTKRSELMDQVVELNQTLFEMNFVKEIDGDALSLLELLRDFVKAFSEDYLLTKRSENAYEFSDISHFAIQILEENDDIRNYYQERFHEVMVDEYQDNNHMQEKMLDLLSNGHNRFMVGDVKQSIYRFRQADPNIFASKFALYHDNPKEGRLILLKENYRSSKEVIDATNDLFLHLMNEEVGDINYNDLQKLVVGKVDAEVNAKNQAEVLIYDTESDFSESEEELMFGEYRLVAKEMIRLHNEEAVKFEDMAILVPSRTNNDAIVSVLNDFDIPVVTDGGEQHYLQAVEVMVMLDTLRSIHQPLNDYALVALMLSEMFDFNEDELTRISLQGGQHSKQLTIFEKIKCALGEFEVEEQTHLHLITRDLKDKLVNFTAQLKAWRTFAKYHSLYDLIWKIYRDRYYYDTVGAQANGRQRQANLYALAIRAHQFEQSGFKGLTRFINMIDTILENENDLDDVEFMLPQNAVTVMTIHKSKGLEFKYVFVLNIDKTFNHLDTSSPIILDRQNGAGLVYREDFNSKFENSHLPQIAVTIPTFMYRQNKERLKVAELSEQMRLLYVAMTRAEIKLYLVGKGNVSKLQDKYDGMADGQFLATNHRKKMSSFQDWLLAVKANYGHVGVDYKLTYVLADELTTDKIGIIHRTEVIDIQNQSHNRQYPETEEILNKLENVDILNMRYDSAIHLPTLRTPSQLKDFYLDVLPTDATDIMYPNHDEEETQSHQKSSFELPTFTKKQIVTSAEVGSAVHELMQRIPLKPDLSLQDVERALKQVSLREEVKKKVKLNRIFDFFQTDFGARLLSEPRKVKREAPFAMLVQDPISKEDFVVRGIIDGYILEENRIILYDFKTDFYRQPQELIERYRQQMTLYAQALKQAYKIETVEKHLVLLGTNQPVQVIQVD